MLRGPPFLAMPDENTIKIEIANDAMAIIGATPILSFDAATNESYLATIYLDRARKWVLSRRPWRDALVTTTLESSTASTLTGFTYIFDFPTGWLRWKVTGQPRQDVRVIGRKLHYNGTALEVSYVKDLETYGEMSEDLRAVIGAYLAVLVAPRLAGSSDITKTAYEIYMARLREAKFVDSAGEATFNEDYSTWIAARTSFRDRDPMTD